MDDCEACYKRPAVIKLELTPTAVLLVCVACSERYYRGKKRKKEKREGE